MKLRGKLVALMIAVAPSLALAQIGNPSFEDTPNFHLWNTYGDNQIEGSSLGSGPIDGVNQALLATATDGTVNSNVVPGTGDSESQIESGLGLLAGSLATFSGSNIALTSAIGQTVSLIAGEQVSFSWDFLTNQTYNDGTSDSVPPSVNWNDFSFMTLSPSGNPSGAQIFELADTFYGYVNNSNLAGGFGTGFTITPPTDPFISETGYHTYSFTVATTGNYILGVGVAHAVLAGQVDDGVNSALLVDNFQITPSTPEPLSLIAFGLLPAYLLRRRRGAR